MEYIQMTLDDWAQMKQKLRQELLGVKQSFVRIGYALRKMDDEKLYERDGYKSIAEFAKAEYGLEASTVSRFISINKAYSVDGYSEVLLEEYADFGRSQLEEMLKLPEADRAMIQPETPRENIREFKKWNKTEPDPDANVQENSYEELIKSFFELHNEILKELYRSEKMNQIETVDSLVEIVNPSGSRTYKKGLYFMMMYEHEIKIKKFGGKPESMSWEEFFKITKALFDNKMKEDEEQQEIEVQQETETEAEKVVIAPAQKESEILEEEKQDEAKNGESNARREQNNIRKQEPAQKETEKTEEKENQQSIEIVKTVQSEIKTQTRKQYIDSLTAQEAAKYLTEEYAKHELKTSDLAFTEEMLKWLKQEVDKTGKRIIEG